MDGNMYAVVERETYVAFKALHKMKLNGNYEQTNPTK